MKKNRINYGLITFFCLMMVIPAPLSIDEYAPSLPAMVDALNGTPSLLQLSISIYMLAFAISQIILGPLSDRFGRRPIIIWATPIFLLGTVLCIISTTPEMLLISRFIQGLGIGAFALTASALIADVFSGDQLHRVTSMFSTTYSFVPIFAPVLGGYIQEYLGWQANFIFIFIVVLCMYLFSLWKLPETHIPPADLKLQPKVLMANYLKVLLHPRYMLAVLGGLCIWSTIIVFSVMGPFLIQNTFGYTPSAYGRFALLVGVGFMLGGFLNLKMLKSRSSVFNTIFALCLMSFSAIVFLLLALSHVDTVWAVILPIFFFMLGAGQAFPNFYAIALSAIPELKGTSNALIGAIILVGAVIITALVAHFQAHSSFVLALIYFGLSLLCLLIYLSLLRIEKI